MAPAARLLDTGVYKDTAGTAIPTPLTCEDVVARRSKTGNFNGGVAAYSNSEMFKESTDWKPLARTWDHRLSTESKRRTHTRLKSLASHLTRPGMISLGGGLPSSDYFPFHSLDVKVPALGRFSEAETAQSGNMLCIGKHDVDEGKSAFDLEVSLNYGLGTGSAQMVRWATEHTEIVHNPPYRNWGCVMTIGSTSSLEMAFRMFLEAGDYVISEEFTFATAVETSKPLGCRFASVSMDGEGMIPSALDELLGSWDEAARGARKPFVVYTVPTGHNPTGATQSLQRRRELYKIAQKHDLIIVEDEPYYFLQMQPYAGASAISPLPRTHREFLEALVPSLLSIDIDGRVIRLDSFSKVLAPGTRVGWVVASDQLCEKFQLHAQTSTQFPSGFSQVILHRLLDEQWGHSGYLNWLIHLRSEYTQRRNIMMAACEKHLPTEVAHWAPPAAGMFHWIGLDITKYPGQEKSALEIESEVFNAAVELGTLVVPGSFFRADDGGEMKKLFVRLTFAAASADAVAEGVKRLGDAIRKVFKIGS